MSRFTPNCSRRQIAFGSHSNSKTEPLPLEFSHHTKSLEFEKRIVSRVQQIEIFWSNYPTDPAWHRHVSGNNLKDAGTLGNQHPQRDIAANDSVQPPVFQSHECFRIAPEELDFLDPCQASLFHLLVKGS